MAKQNNTKVVTGIVRLSYANVWEPKSINGGDPKYSCSVIIPKTDTETVSAINAAIDCAIKEGIGKFGGKVPTKGALKLPLRDGDIERDDDAYVGCYFTNANSKTAPQIVDKYSDYVRKPGGKIIDDHEDMVTGHHRGYGKSQRPEDYLDAFKDFIMHNMNEIEALKIVCTRPGDLTREALKSLRLELDRHDFNELQLNTAWHDMTNQDITANIISFIRQQALGSALISHEKRVKLAFARLKQEHPFNAVQISWLNRIEKTMLEEAVLDETTFEMGAYKTNGGFAMIDRRFGGQLKEYIRAINTYIYDDGGNVA